MSSLQTYPNKKAPPTLEMVVRRIDDISTLPTIAMRVIEVANDPDSGAADLKQAIEADASLAARVLRCVNSSAYATRTKITNLQHAIAYLGQKQIRNLALTASVSRLFKDERSVGPYRRSGLWRHLVSVGICARLIAMRRKLYNFEDMFLAGLLHDIGIVFEDQHVHQSFYEVMRHLEPAKTLATVEVDNLGFAHTVLGARVAEAWNFPGAITDAIRHHHASADYRGDHADIVQCVEVANLLCTLKGITSVGMKLVAGSQSALASLSLGKHDVTVLVTDLERELERQASLFEL